MADQANPGSVVAQPNAGAPPAGGSPPAGEITVAPEILEWGKSKGYGDNFGDILKSSPDAYKMATSYRETEKFLGGDKIPLPKDMNDQAALKQVFGKLGMPEKPEGYKLQVPAGQPEDFANWARSTFHEANLTQPQAEKLNTAWNGYIEGMLKADDTRRSELAAADQVGLEKDWGPKMNENREIAVRAQNMLSSELGIPRDRLIDGLEETFGLRDSMRILHFLGTRAQVTGDTFEGGAHGDTRGGGGSVMSAEDAKAEKNRLFNDPKFVKDYRNRDAGARQKIDNLNTMIAGEMPQTAPKVTIGQPGRR